MFLWICDLFTLTCQIYTRFHVFIHIYIYTYMYIGWCFHFITSHLLASELVVNPMTLPRLYLSSLQTLRSFTRKNRPGRALYPKVHHWWVQAILEVSTATIVPFAGIKTSSFKAGVNSTPDCPDIPIVRSCVLHDHHWHVLVFTCINWYVNIYICIYI